MWRGPSGIGALTREQEIDELVDEWTPEPLVAATTPTDEVENEKRPILVGYAATVAKARKVMLMRT